MGTPGIALGTASAVACCCFDEGARCLRHRLPWICGVPHVVAISCSSVTVACLRRCCVVDIAALPFLHNTTLLLLPAGVLLIFTPLRESVLLSSPTVWERP